jgi:uncharacterized protein
MSSNIATVQQIYACFAQGDVPGILAKLADNVTFFNGSDPNVAPFGGEFKGRDGVVQFFTALGSTAQTTHFEPSNFREEGGKVLNDVRHDGIIPATNKPFSVNVLFTWEFNEDGQAVNWKGTGDFSSINQAFS